MTSSWALTQRKRMGNVWSFGFPESPLGGWEDHYIINGAVRECHPNYETIPIGNKYGFAVCVRRKGESGKTLDLPQTGLKPEDLSSFNGYHRFQADLYRPWRKEAIQLYNPLDYYDRTTPNEKYLHREDYLARDIRYNGAGVEPMRTPGNRKYFEYGYSFAPDPPYKYDISRLEQPYPIWKNERKHLRGRSGEHGNLDKFDTKYFDARV